MANTRFFYLRIWSITLALLASSPSLAELIRIETEIARLEAQKHSFHARSVSVDEIRFNQVNLDVLNTAQKRPSQNPLLKWLGWKTTVKFIDSELRDSLVQVLTHPDRGQPELSLESYYLLFEFIEDHKRVWNSSNHLVKSLLELSDLQNKKKIAEIYATPRRNIYVHLSDPEKPETGGSFKLAKKISKFPGWSPYILIEPKVEKKGWVNPKEAFEWEQKVRWYLNTFLEVQPKTQGIHPTLEMGNYYIIEERFDGDLLDLLTSEPDLKLSSQIDIAEQLIDGLIAFHRLGFYNGDIKPDNILVKTHETLTGIRYRVSYTDFGLSYFPKPAIWNFLSLPDGSLSFTDPKGNPLIPNEWIPEYLFIYPRQKPFSGTPGRAAPEIFMGINWSGTQVDELVQGTLKSDIFSLGTVFYHLRRRAGQLPWNLCFKKSNRQPLESSSQCQKRLMNAFLEDPYLYIPNPQMRWPYHSFDELVFACLRVQPEKRISAEILKESIFYIKEKYSKVHAPSALSIQDWEAAAIKIGGLANSQIDSAYAALLTSNIGDYVVVPYPGAQNKNRTAIAVHSAKKNVRFLILDISIESTAELLKEIEFLKKIGTLGNAFYEK